MLAGWSHYLLLQFIMPAKMAVVRSVAFLTVVVASRRRHRRIECPQCGQEIRTQLACIRHCHFCGKVMSSRGTPTGSGSGC